MNVSSAGEVLSHSFDHSAEFGTIAAALSKAQGAMEGAEKSATNPHFNRKYADLAACWEAAREPLSKNELAVVQMTESSPDGVAVISMLCHSSGQWFRSRLWMPTGERATPQQIGSAITYGRRYGFCALVGIAPEEDDGEAAQQAATRAPTPRPAQSSPVTGKRTEAQAAREMSELLDKALDKSALDSVWKMIETMPFREPALVELKASYARNVSRVLAAAS